MNEAIKKFKLKKPEWVEPEGYTWHHIENSTELQLVPRDLHRIVKHHGGRSTMN
ncbi:HNH endonuclease [Flavobacterium oreochromis]|uniref:HNH endonuclease signature motif containing protein n=1 Tax=Flavobacterium oreochromis TaxID=2906078 RepID=UPI001CE59C48|nr:HNH endonuclease [Flavobacterium oreochromis]